MTRLDWTVKVAACGWSVPGFVGAGGKEEGDAGLSPASASTMAPPSTVLARSYASARRSVATRWPRGEGGVANFQSVNERPSVKFRIRLFQHGRKGMQRNQLHYISYWKIPNARVLLETAENRDEL